MRAALQAIIANLVIHANATVAAFEEEADGDTASLILNQRDDAPKGRENTERVMAHGKLVIHSIAGAPVPLVEAAIVHDKGSSGRAVEAFHLSDPLRRQRNVLTFDRALLDRRIGKSDVAYHALIQGTRTARAEVEGGTLEEVRAEIPSDGAEPALQRVADSLRMPPRSLQRRLQAEGLSFRDLWTSGAGPGRCRWSPTPGCRCRGVEALGYSELSVFTQAFRRW